MQKRSSSQRISIILGGVMAFVLVAGVVLPLLSPNTSVTAPVASATPRPSATFPAPITDTSTISLAENYLHPSGIFSIAQPSGFTSGQPTTDATSVHVNLNNGETVSVIHGYVEDINAETPLAAADLSARFNAEVLARTWNNFSNWRETGRTTQDERLLIDFNVDQGGRNFIARQAVWTDGTLIYSVRIVAPANARDYLLFMLNAIIPTLRVYPQFLEQPLDWNATFDPIAAHIVRAPSTWQVIDGAAGRPLTLAGANGETLRLEETIAPPIDEASAGAFVQARYPNAAIVSTAPYERAGVSGLTVAYNTATVDGDPISGLVSLYSAADGTLHSADLRVPFGALDLNTTRGAASASAAVPGFDLVPQTTAQPTPDAFAAQRDAIYTQIVDSFQPFSGGALAAGSGLPTPTALPTRATATPPFVLVPEVTSEATADAVEVITPVEVTAEASLEAAPEASAAAEPTSAATADATSEATASS